MADLEAAFPEEFARTAASRFRSATDISVTNSLYHYYALLTGHAVVQTDAAGQVRRDDAAAGAARDGAPAQAPRPVDMFCLNDGSFPEISVEQRTAAVIDFLERYFPFPAPWEKPTDAAGQPPIAVDAASDLTA